MSLQITGHETVRAMTAIALEAVANHRPRSRARSLAISLSSSDSWLALVTAATAAASTWAMPVSIRALEVREALREPDMSDAGPSRRS